MHAPHWYDQLTLFFGHFRPWCTLDASTLEPALGNSAVQRLHQRQLANLEKEASHFDEAPTLIGEVGVPFDLDNKALYALPFKGKEDTDVDVPLIDGDRALAHSVDCLDARNLSYTLWLYEPTHSMKWHDGWNMEDLSLFSRTPAARYVALDRDPLNVHFGARGLRAFSRPFCRRLSGVFERAPTFHSATGTFRLEFRADHALHAPTEIFVPEAVQYPDGFVVELSDGEFTLERAPDAVGGYAPIHYTPGPGDYLRIVVIRRAGADPAAGGGCCVQSGDEALLPSKPSTETLLALP